MADFEGGLPIKTVRDNDAAFKLVDGASGTTATKKLSVAGVGDAVTASTNDFGVPVLGKDATGNYALLALSATGEALVSAANLDIRDLAFATDKVDVSGSEVSLDATTLAALENITVSATDLDIRDLAFATDSVDVSGSTVELGATTLAALETITVTATDLDIRDLAFATDSVDVSGSTVELGATTLAALENITVTVAPPVGVVDVCDYQTTPTLGANSVATHDYVVTNAKTFTGHRLLVGARGATKIELGTWNGTAFTTKFVYFQQIQGNIDHDISKLSLLGNGTNAVRVRITNTDGQSSDVYSTLQGSEV